MIFRVYIFTILFFASSLLYSRDNVGHSLIIGSYTSIQPYLMMSDSGKITGIEQDLISILRKQNRKRDSFYPLQQGGSF